MTAEPETRFVNRCIYSPIENRPDVGDDIPGWVPKQPFLRLAILQTVLDSPQLADLITGQIKGEGWTYPQDERLATAVRHAWDGELPEAAALLQEVEPHELRDFAFRALDVHEHLVTNAEQDLDHAITDLARAQPKVEGNGDRPPRPGVPGRPSRLVAPGVGTNQLLLEVRQAVREELQAHVGLRPLDTTPGTAAGTTGAAGGAAPDDATPAPTVVEERPGVEAAGALQGRLLGVSHDDVQSVLLQHAPATARFLALERYFALPKPMLVGSLGEIGRYVTFTTWQRLQLGRKKDVLQGLDLLGAIEPVGYLHLERLHFTPVGYVRGELVYSLPLTPGEVCRVSHREWTRTESEYATLVATSLETATQDSLAEKTELTESVSTQQQHTSAFNSSVTASGGFGPVQISTSVGYNATAAASKTATQSSSHAQEITRTASSRAKQEHKVSFRVTTTREVEDVSYREIKNESDHPVRWDFNRLMQKWRIDLYRYDVRMTYDIVVPEPGSYLLLRYIRLHELQRRIDQVFELTGAEGAGWNGHPSGIGPFNYEEIERVYEVALDPPPDPEVPTSAHGETTYSQKLIGFDYVELSLPQGYEFSLSGLHAEGSHFRRGDTQSGYIDPDENFNRARLQDGAYAGNTYQWRYYYDWSEDAEAEQGSVMSVAVYAHGYPSAELYQAWQSACYQRVVDAAKARFEARRQRLVDIRDRLQAEIDRDDDLALRKVEREEIMKSVLRWVLGRRFEFYPAGLPDLEVQLGHDLPYYDGDGLVKPDYVENGDVEGTAANAMARHAATIRFLHHAIEWENVNYVLYPYFWTDRPRWGFKQQLFHSDYEHRSFLRAGAARVVLTIRPGFEKAFLSFMETGKLDGLEADAPYITVADELKQLAETNYPYTPSANEENPANLVDTWNEFTPTGALDVSLGTALDA